MVPGDGDVEIASPLGLDPISLTIADHLHRAVLIGAQHRHAVLFQLGQRRRTGMAEPVVGPALDDRQLRTDRFQEPGVEGSITGVVGRFEDGAGQVLVAGQQNLFRFLFTSPGSRNEIWP